MHLEPPYDLTRASRPEGVSLTILFRNDRPTIYHRVQAAVKVNGSECKSR